MAGTNSASINGYEIPTLSPALINASVQVEPVSNSTQIELTYLPATDLTWKDQVRRRRRAPVVPLHGPRERIKTRFRILKQLRKNHDGEGAAAPIKSTIDDAIAFVDRVSHHPDFFATIDDDGCAVIEFEDRGRGFFGDLTFRPTGRVECYRRLTGQVSLEHEAENGSADLAQFLADEMHVFLR